jgi:dTDP-4-dehydrorhamnose reductase
VLALTDLAERAVLVVGAAGQLGQTVVASFKQQWTTVGLTRHELDVTNTGEVNRVVRDLCPSAIVNCVGYNDVDKAEDNAVRALAANAFAVLALARAAASVDATLVHYSSDFVFDGETDRPYCEDDLPAPRSVYAASKLLGEWFAVESPAHYILRVESLFGGEGPHKSSLDRIIASIEAGGPVRVFVDRTVSPSYAWDVATATAGVLRRRPAAGIYHCVNTGAASWYEVAIEVRRRIGSASALEPMTLGDVKLPAPRPRYCALANDKLRAVGVDMPTWQDALGRYIDVRQARTTG